MRSRETNRAGFLGGVHDARIDDPVAEQAAAGGMEVEVGDPGGVMTAPPVVRAVPHGPPTDEDGYAPDNAIYVRRAGGWTLEVVDE